jgi:hypothetical protein
VLPAVGTDTAVGLLAGGGLAVRAAGAEAEALGQLVQGVSGQAPASLIAETAGDGSTTGVVLTGEIMNTTPLDNLPNFTDAVRQAETALAVVYVDLDWLAETLDLKALAPFRAAGLAVGPIAQPGLVPLRGTLVLDDPVEPIEDGAVEGTPSEGASAPSSAPGSAPSSAPGSAPASAPATTPAQPAS